MPTAKLGDRVRIQYVRLHKPGATTARPPEKKMLEFTVGSRKVLRGLSLGIVGMGQGDRKHFTLQPAQAYGKVQSRLIAEIPRAKFPKHLALHVGQRLTAQAKASGRRRRVRVVALNPESVVVDGNHRLAGRVVKLDVTLISIDSSSNANRSRPQCDVGGES